MLVWIALSALTGCGERAQCGGSGGAWSECAATTVWCVDGEVVEEGEAPAICEAGCTCPADAPVWDAAKGCMSAETCAGSCTDADEDGSCAEDDCDDASADVFPGVEECWLPADALDNNCDGRVDECSCADATGFTPSSPELCDGRDNDCDGDVDEEGC